MTQPEYRRAQTLMIYWHDGELTAENYLESRSTDTETDNAVAVDAQAVAPLEHFTDWLTAEKVAAQLGEFELGSVHEAVSALADAGLLIDRAAARANSPADARPREP
ncbi:hypothetical protein AB0I81_00165 [Nonomuraea sp. NPDC050404]|uniref:hypothetical protein n=1 Tax=Nonomuraea sp. NPDC050404 TaxID=3155783 RepID=UPI003407CB11